jgi:hypothetical protein
MYSWQSVGRSIYPDYSLKIFLSVCALASLALASCGGQDVSIAEDESPATAAATLIPIPPPTHTPELEPAATEEISLTTELVAYYPFSGDAEDASGNGNHGLVVGATLIPDRFGNRDNAYQFDGIDDIIEVPFDPSLNLNFRGSISLWLKYEPQAPDTYYTLVEKSDPDRGGHARYGMWIIGNRAEFCIDSASAGFQQCLDSEVALRPGEWHHIAGVTNGDSLTIYIDGQAAGSSSYPRDSISVSGFELFMGADLYNDQVVYLAGGLDDIRLYRRALSPDEVQQLFTETP